MGWEPRMSTGTTGTNCQDYRTEVAASTGRRKGFRHVLLTWADPQLGTSPISPVASGRIAAFEPAGAVAPGPGSIHQGSQAGRVYVTGADSGFGTWPREDSWRSIRRRMRTRWQRPAPPTSCWMGCSPA